MSPIISKVDFHLEPGNSNVRNPIKVDNHPAEHKSMVNVVYQGNDESDLLANVGGETQRRAGQKSEEPPSLLLGAASAPMGAAEKGGPDI